MVYDGKTYRNLQDQVAYLTSMYKALGEQIEKVAAQIPSKMIVEELPEEGDPLITYYVGPKGTAPNQYYEVWVWVQEVEDGPFVWRELEDTDQVDLSGYLEKVTDATTYGQVYIKNAGGTNTLRNFGTEPSGDFIVARTDVGQIYVPETPTHNLHATSKKYVGDTFVAKQTGATTKYQVYGKAADGTQGMLDVTTENFGATLMFRDANGRARVAEPSGDGDAVNKKYCDDTFVAQDTGGASTYYHVYCKNPNGTQGWMNAYGSPVAGALPIYQSGGVLKTNTPSEGSDAANKQYVDAAVGQLLYLHEIYIEYTIDASTELGITCYLVNGSPTAITSLTRAEFMRITPSYGALNPGQADTTACAITKIANGFRLEDYDEPYPGFLYQYYSGGSLTSGNTFGIIPTVTDVVVSF